jgi:hypothetical protein
MPSVAPGAGLGVEFFFGVSCDRTDVTETMAAKTIAASKLNFSLGMFSPHRSAMRHLTALRREKEQKESL